jgi:hypothetical protein
MPLIALSISLSGLSNPQTFWLIRLTYVRHQNGHGLFVSWSRHLRNLVIDIFAAERVEELKR